MAINVTGNCLDESELGGGGSEALLLLLPPLLVLELLPCHLSLLTAAQLSPD